MQSQFLPFVAIRVPFAYYYISPDHLEKIQSFREVAGDPETTLVTQYVRGWIGRNRQYYWGLARADAEARGMALKTWGEVVIEGSMDDLPDYQRSPDYSVPDPLRDVFLPRDTVKRNMNYLTLGKQNTALLKVGAYHSRDPIVGFVSRIVHEHLERNWDKLYAPQVEMDNLDNWK